MVDALKMLSVQQRVNYNTLILIFKIHNKMVPTYLQDEILYTREATTRTLRNADDFRLPRYQRSYTQNMIWTAARQNENETSKDLKNTLASLLKKDFLKEMYEFNYVKNCKTNEKLISL
jgi:hypothetical protein